MRLMKLAGSEQAKDIGGGKAPSGVYGDVGRVKTYIKPDEFYYAMSVRDLEFDQPYQVAAEATGRSWNKTNPVFTVQFAGCNIRCPGCFLGDEVSDGETVDMDPRDVVYLFDTQKESVVMRLSGGEPLLQQDALLNFMDAWDSWIRAASPIVQDYLWLDTNLTIEPEQDLLDYFSMELNTNRGVCGCFKPSLGGDMLETQFANARRYIEAGVDFFAYWPSNLDNEPEPVERWDEWVAEGRFACRMLADEVHPMLPLRTTFLYWKYHYNAQSLVDWKIGKPTSWADMTGPELTALSAGKTQAMRWGQDIYAEAGYHRSHIWLPSHKVSYC